MAIYFSNKSFMHFLIIQDTLLLNKVSPAQYFVFDYYIKTVFKDILSNINVAKISIAENSQFKTLQNEMLKIKMIKTCANKTTLYFENKMPLSLISTIQVRTSVGIPNFHVVDIFISFFFI